MKGLLWFQNTFEIDSQFLKTIIQILKKPIPEISKNLSSIPLEGKNHFALFVHPLPLSSEQISISVYQHFFLKPFAKFYKLISKFWAVCSAQSPNSVVVVFKCRIVKILLQ